MNDTYENYEHTDDELMMSAIEFAVESGTITATMIQKRFLIGYNRALRILNEMDNMGILGPEDGNNPRKVYKVRICR